MNNIQSLNNISALTFGGISECKCNNNSQAFDIVMMSLLKAVAKQQSTTNEQQTSDLLMDNTIQTITKLESSNKDVDINKKIDNAISVSSKKYGVDENLIRAIIKVESNFNPNCVSKAGAKGLMQLMPENCTYYGIKDPFDIEQNIDGGTRHIKDYLDKYNGDVQMALMAYNGGPTRMAKRGVTSIEHIYKMPQETQNYVPKVMKYYKNT